MYVVTKTSNVTEKGKAYLYETEDEGIEKMKELYKKYLKKFIRVDMDHTYMNEDFTYGQVSDGMCVNELRLMKIA